MITPTGRRRFRFGVRLQLAAGWWRIRLRFPPRVRRGWLVLLLLGAPFGYVLSLPIVVYLYSRLEIAGGGWLEPFLEIYYLPLIWLAENWPWLETFVDWCVETLEFVFGES